MIFLNSNKTVLIGADAFVRNQHFSRGSNKVLAACSALQTAMTLLRFQQYLGGGNVFCHRVKCSSHFARYFVFLFLIVFGIDGRMTCDFTSFLTVFQSYQYDVWMIMKSCVQWNSVYG